jgi:hypothetical protein
MTLSPRSFDQPGRAMLKHLAIFSSLQRRRPAGEVTVGSRFYRRESPSIVWEVQSLFVGKDGVRYAGLFCTADPTLRKTLSQEALRQDGRNVQVPDR